MNKPTFKDVTGQKFGKLTAIERIAGTGHRHAYWKCMCECGKKKLVLAANLIAGGTKSCGGKSCKAKPKIFY